MSDDRLMVPADLVSESKHTLRYKFPLLLVVGALKDAGRFLHVATNASARDMDVHTKIQDILFDLIKICDGFLLVSTSIKTGAKDIVEALGIAYLYLVDSFPDMAFTKMDSLQTTMEGMRKRVDSVSATLSQTKIKLQQACTITRQPQEQVTRNFELCLQTLNAAKNQLDLIEEYCRDLSPIVDRWLQECREVAQPQMARNRQDAERLSKGDQKKYWKELMNQTDVKLYLARWRALTELCEEYHPTLKRTRDTIDSYYTNNPMPNEAISLAWKDAAKLPIADVRWKALLAGQDLPRLVGPKLPVDLPESSPVDNISDGQTTYRDHEQSIEVTLRRSGGSVNMRKAVTSAVSRFFEMSHQLNGIQSFACGFFCGLKKNPHTRRFLRLQDEYDNLTGQLPNQMKQTKSPPFQGIFEHFNKDLGLSVARYPRIPIESGELQKDVRGYSDSLTESMTINPKSVAKALKKIDKSVGTLLKDMNHACEKLDRDLSEKPKYDPENWVNWDEDKDKMKTMRKNLKDAMKVVEDWKKQIEKCTVLLAKAEAASKEGDMRAIKENCHILKKMLEKEMHRPKSETNNVPERDSLTNIQ